MIAIRFNGKKAKTIIAGVDEAEYYNGVYGGPYPFPQICKRKTPAQQRAGGLSRVGTD